MEVVVPALRIADEVALRVVEGAGQEPPRGSAPPLACLKNQLGSLGLCRMNKEGVMWWVISLIALVWLVIEAVGVTFILMVALNGFPSLPDAFVYIYLVCTCGLLPALSLLDGFLAKKFSEIKALPLGHAGILTMIASSVILPILLCGLTFVLLLAFGMI